MKQLSQIAELLKQKNRNGNYSHFVDVYDLDAAKYAQKNVDQDFLNVHYNGSFKAFINSLRENYNELQLNPRVRNGSGSKPAGAALHLKATTTEAANEAIQVPKSPAMPSLAAPVSQQAQVGLMGLSGAEIMANFADARHLPEVKAQLREVQRELEKEREKRKEAERKCQKKSNKLERLMYQNEIQPGPGLIDKILSVIGETDIPTLISALNSKGQGLQGPAEPEELSPVKQNLIQVVKDWPDPINEVILHVYQRYAENDQGFIENLNNLISTPKLQKVQDNA